MRWREAVATLNREKPPVQLRKPEPPKYDGRELYGVIPTDARKPFDVREIIARIVDGSEFHEFKARFGATLVCGFAHIEGMPVGIIANNGILFSGVGAKGPTSSNCAATARCRWCSCRTSPASWWAARSKARASPATAPSW